MSHADHLLHAAPAARPFAALAWADAPQAWMESDIKVVVVNDS